MTEEAHYLIRVAAEDAHAAKEKAFRLFFSKPLTPVDYRMPKIADVTPY